MTHFFFWYLQGIARLQRHEQIIDEVKLALKPFFKHGEIDKDDYKLIMRKSVEKVCGIVFYNDLLWSHSRRVVFLIAGLFLAKTGQACSRW